MNEEMKYKLVNNFQNCSAELDQFLHEKNENGLEDAKVNISVGALALNAHNELLTIFGI